MQRKVHPNGGGTTCRANQAGDIGALQGGPAFKGGTANVAGIHFDQHIARVFELLVKVTKRIDDDGVFAPSVRQATDAVHPVDKVLFACVQCALWSA